MKFYLGEEDGGYRVKYEKYTCRRHYKLWQRNSNTDLHVEDVEDNWY